MKEVSVNGNSILLINSGGKFYAIDSRCSHMHLPLAKGKIDGNIITCPYHGSQFNITDGSVVHGPAKVALKNLSSESRRRQHRNRSIKFK